MSLRKSCSESVEISRASAFETSLARLHFVGRAHDLDLHLFERVVEVVELRRVEVELVERERDLLRAEQPSGGLRGLEEMTSFVRLQNVRDSANFRGFLRAHGPPCLGDAALCLPHRTGRYGPFGSYFSYWDPPLARARRSAFAWLA